MIDCTLLAPVVIAGVPLHTTFDGRTGLEHMRSSPPPQFTRTGLTHRQRIADDARLRPFEQHGRQ